MNENYLPEEVISSKIYFITDQKVMLDSDLASLYADETKQLKRHAFSSVHEKLKYKF